MSRVGTEIFAPRASEQSALFQFYFIQSKVMTELVDIGDVNLVAVKRFVLLRKVPETFEKENDLARQWAAFTFGDIQSVADKETQQIIVEAVGHQVRTRDRLKMDRQGFGVGPQIPRQ